MSKYAIDIKQEDKRFFVKSKTEFTKNGKPKTFPVNYSKVSITITHKATGKSFTLETSNRMNGWKDSRDGGRLNNIQFRREVERMLAEEQVRAITRKAI